MVWVGHDDPEVLFQPNWSYNSVSQQEKLTKAPKRSIWTVPGVTVQEEYLCWLGLCCINLQGTQNREKNYGQDTCEAARWTRKPRVGVGSSAGCIFFFFFSSRKKNPENKFFLPEANYRAKDDALLVTALEVSVNLKDKWQGRSA